MAATKHIKSKTVAERKDQVSRGKTGQLRVHILLGHFWLLGWGSERAGVCADLGYGLKRQERAHRSAQENRGPRPCAPSPGHFLLPELFQS